MPHLPSLKKLDSKKISLHILFLTVVFEAITLFSRFGLGIEATRDTASSIGELTGGIRIHHGYIGALLIGAFFVSKSRWPNLSKWILIVGVSLLISDLIHHFLVLWPLTGDHMFHLVYPSNSPTDFP